MDKKTKEYLLSSQVASNLLSVINDRVAELVHEAGEDFEKEIRNHTQTKNNRKKTARKG